MAVDFCHDRLGAAGAAAAEECTAARHRPPCLGRGAIFNSIKVNVNWLSPGYEAVVENALVEQRGADWNLVRAPDDTDADSSMVDAG